MKPTEAPIPTEPAFGAQFETPAIPSNPLLPHWTPQIVLLVFINDYLSLSDYLPISAEYWTSLRL